MGSTPRIVAARFLFAVVVLYAIGAQAQTLAPHVPGRLLVQYHEGSGPVSPRILAMHGALQRRHVPALRLQVLDVAESASEAVRQSLVASGLFDFVEPDFYAHTAAAPSETPNDPSYLSQWYLPKIRSGDAWSVTTGSPSVVIGVIDSGVYGAHPDLAGKIAPGWNFVDGNADTSDKMGHGTAVAGTLAAATNNAIGVAGVTWASRIMPLVVVDAADFAAYSDMAAALRYAVDHGVRIINVSIGGTSPSSTLQSAVDYAWSRGALVFAAAMNSSSNAPYYPAACNHAIAVSATDENDRLASFSNFGAWVTLSAPGTDILTTMNGGGYGYKNGTSFSSPIAAGVAALCLAVNPALSNAALLSLLEGTADQVGKAGFDPSFGYGRINAAGAVRAARPAPPPPPHRDPSVPVRRPR